MSYENMNHAAWVERNNSAANSMYGNRKAYKPAPEKLSDLQAKTMDILGMVCGGIYNAPISWDKVDWDYGYQSVSVILRDGRLATWDFQQLTKLVFLCHEARIRCEIRSHTRGYFRLTFSQRVHEGDMSTRHPNIDEAVAAFRAYLPENHRIIYATTAADGVA